MTIKKTLISTVAAGALAAMITGCGGGGGSSATTTSDTTTTSSSTGVKKDITAVDGYILNAKVTGTYYDDKNVSQTITLVGTDAKYDIATKKWNADGKPSPVYKAPDANASILNKIVSYTIKSNGGSTTTSGVTTPATFIDVDGDGEYNSSIDTLFTSTLTVPSTSKIASPLTAAVYTLMKSLITKGVEINSTIQAAIDGNASKLADALGMSGVDLTTADPVELEKKYPVLRIATAALLANPADASTLIKQKKATKLEDALANLKTSLTGNAKLAVSKILSNVKAGVKIDEILSTYNLEQSMANGDLKADNSKKVTLKTLEKFPVAGFKIDNEDTVNLVNKGDKIAKLDLNISMPGVASMEKNVSSTTATIYVKISGNEPYKAKDSNVSQQIAFTLPVDLNITSNKVYATVAKDAMVKFQLLGAGGMNEYSSELNASKLGLVDNNGNTVVIDGSGTTNLQLDLNKTATKIMSAADSNLSGVFSESKMLSNISDVKIYIDDKGKFQALGSDGLPTLFASGDFTGVDTSLSATGLIKVFDSADKDFRGGATRANSAPNYDANVTDITNLATNAGITANTTEVNGSTNIVMLNTDTSASDKNITLGFAKKDTDTFEYLTKFTTSTASKPVIAIGAIKDVNGTDSATVAIKVDTNYTASDYSSITGKHPKYVFTYKPTDEFGKAGEERNVTIALNRVPEANRTNTTPFLLDVNNTNDSAQKVYSFVVSGAVKDIDGMSDVNTSGGNVALKIIDVKKNAETNVTVYGIGVDSTGLNINVLSSSKDKNITIVPASGFLVTKNGDINFTISIPDSNASTDVVVGGTASDLTDFNVSGGGAIDFNITIVPVDYYGAYSYDKNKTLRFRIDANTTGAVTQSNAIF